MPEPEQVLVARGADVEPLMRAARAEIAQLSLQIRSVEHEAAELEAELASDDTSARDLLRISLDELIESRRQELEQVLEQELVRAAAVVSAAQDAVVPSHLEPSPLAQAPVPATQGTSLPLLPLAPTSRRRLQVVVEPEDDTGGCDPREAADPQGASVPRAGTGGVVIDAPRAGAVPLPDEPDAEDATVPAVLEVEPVAEVWADPVPEPEGAAEVEEPRLVPEPARSVPFDAPDDAPSVSTAGVWGPLSDVPGDPALLRELVSAAVTAAVAQAVDALATGSGRSVPPASTDGPTGVHGAIPVHSPRRPNPPLRRQLLHLDVLLPLVLVVIVFVVLLAWVG